MHYGADSLSHYDRGNVRKLLSDSLAESRIGLVVESRRGVVQHKYLRRACNGTGNEQSLSLTAAEVSSLGVEMMVESVVKALDKLRRLSYASGIHYLLVGKSPSEIYVVSYASRIDKVVLHNDAKA